jgi:hypothetical protein
LFCRDDIVAEKMRADVDLQSAITIAKSTMPSNVSGACLERIYNPLT